MSTQAKTLRGSGRRGESGQSVIEMALGLPLFLVAMVGIFEYSIVFFTYLNATYACRFAARYASLHSTSSVSPVNSAQVQNMVKAHLYLAPVLTPTVNVTYLTSSFTTGSNTVGNFVAVSTNWSQSVTIPFANNTWSFSVASQDVEVITR